MIYSYHGYFKTSKSLISELYIYWDVTFVDGGGGDCKKAGGCTCNVDKKKKEAHNISGLGTASLKESRNHRSRTSLVMLCQLWMFQKGKTGLAKLITIIICCLQTSGFGGLDDLDQ